MISVLVAVLSVMLLVLICYVSFLHGRNYERKQYIQIGSRCKHPTVQDIFLGKDR